METQVTKKLIATAHMSFVKNLAQYTQGKSQFRAPTSVTAHVPKIYAHPAQETYDDDDDVGDADECCNVQIPVANFKSN